MNKCVLAWRPDNGEDVSETFKLEKIHPDDSVTDDTHKVTTVLPWKASTSGIGSFDHTKDVCDEFIEYSKGFDKNRDTEYVSGGTIFDLKRPAGCFVTRELDRPNHENRDDGRKIRYVYYNQRYSYAPCNENDMCVRKKTREELKNKGDVISKLEASYGSCIGGEGTSEQDCVGGSWKSNWFDSKRPVEFKAEKMTSGVPNLSSKSKASIGFCMSASHALRVPFVGVQRSATRPAGCYVDNTTSGKPVLRHNSKHSSTTSCSSVYECISEVRKINPQQQQQNNKKAATMLARKAWGLGTRKGELALSFEGRVKNIAPKIRKKTAFEIAALSPKLNDNLTIGKGSADLNIVPKLNDNLTIGKVESDNRNVDRPYKPSIWGQKKDLSACACSEVIVNRSDDKIFWTPTPIGDGSTASLIRKIQKGWQVRTAGKNIMHDATKQLLWKSARYVGRWSINTATAEMCKKAAKDLGTSLVNETFTGETPKHVGCVLKDNKIHTTVSSACSDAVPCVLPSAKETSASLKEQIIPLSTWWDSKGEEGVFTELKESLNSKRSVRKDKVDYARESYNKQIERINMNLRSVENDAKMLAKWPCIEKGEATHIKNKICGSGETWTEEAVTDLNGNRGDLSDNKKWVSTMYGSKCYKPDSSKSQSACSGTAGIAANAWIEGKCWKHVPYRIWKDWRGRQRYRSIRDQKDCEDNNFKKRPMGACCSATKCETLSENVYKATEACMASEVEKRLSGNEMFVRENSKRKAAKSYLKELNDLVEANPSLVEENVKYDDAVGAEETDLEKLLQTMTTNRSCRIVDGKPMMLGGNVLGTAIGRNKDFSWHDPVTFTTCGDSTNITEYDACETFANKLGGFFIPKRQNLPLLPFGCYAEEL